MNSAPRSAHWILDSGFWILNSCIPPTHSRLERNSIPHPLNNIPKPIDQTRTRALYGPRMEETITPSNGHNSARQLRANRANAKKSTGPRTEEGKQRSSMNSLRHGLTARAIVMPAEDPAAFQRHAQEFIEEYKPKGPTEIQLVQNLAESSWLLNRIKSLEDEVLHPKDPDSISLALQIRALTGFDMQRARLSRLFERTVKQLREAQQERRALERSQMYDALPLFQMDQEKGVEYDPAQDGFVFSMQDFRTYIHHRTRLAEAKDATNE